MTDYQSPRIKLLSNTLKELKKNPLIGNPIRNEKEGRIVYEFKELTPLRMAYIKAVRSVSTMNAIRALFKLGHTIEAGTLIRCVFDCSTEIAFILEKHPEYSKKVRQLIDIFQESPIDLNKQDAKPVPYNEMINARLRSYGIDYNSPKFEKSKKTMDGIYRTYSGYVHTGYHHTMEIFNGQSQQFDVTGLKYTNPKHEQLATEMEEMTAIGLHIIAKALNEKVIAEALLSEIFREHRK